MKKPALLFAGGCAKFTEPFKDAPRSKVDNGKPADLIRTHAPGPLRRCETPQSPHLSFRRYQRAVNGEVPDLPVIGCHGY